MELGYELIWHNPADKRMKRIYVRLEADLKDRDSWAALYAWLLARLEELKAVFASRVKDLTLPDGDVL